jgi:hypothetical protein
VLEEGTRAPARWPNKRWRKFKRRFGPKEKMTAPSTKLSWMCSRARWTFCFSHQEKRSGYLRHSHFQITSEYLGMLDLMKDLDLNLAGDYLVMAATLMQIKAKSLLPKAVVGRGRGRSPADLVNRLLEYQRFKEASRHLGTKADRRQRRSFPRDRPAIERNRLHDGGVPVRFAWMRSGTF